MRIKIELAYKQGASRITTYLKPDEATTFADVVRVSNWQAAMVGVTGMCEQMEYPRRDGEPHKLFYRGATANVWLKGVE